MKIRVEVLDSRDKSKIEKLDIKANPCRKCRKQPYKIMICYGPKPYLVYCKCNSMPTEGVGGILENAITQWNKENKLKIK